LTAEAPDLFIELATSDLVIFKGDLNHRKVSPVGRCVSCEGEH
jgi:hypothetical protein